MTMHITAPTTSGFPLALAKRNTSLSRIFPDPSEGGHDHQQARRIRKTQAAVLFVDLVGFTGFVASVTPVEAMTLLQAFYAHMERCVLAHNGRVETYLGDGLMVTFGARAPTPTSAVDAVRCAKSMLAALDEWNAERAAAHEPAIRIGIGAHYGEVALGLVGVLRSELAVVGNPVNIANRLQQLASDRQFAIVMSEALLQQGRSEAPSGDSALDSLAFAGEWQVSGAMIAVATYGRLAHRHFAS